MLRKARGSAGLPKGGARVVGGVAVLVGRLSTRTRILAELAA